MLGLVTAWMADYPVSDQISHLVVYPTTKVNSAFHPFRVDKPSTGLFGWGYGGASSPVLGGR